MRRLDLEGWAEASCSLRQARCQRCPQESVMVSLLSLRQSRGLRQMAHSVEVSMKVVSAMIMNTPGNVGMNFWECSTIACDDGVDHLGIALDVRRDRRGSGIRVSEFFHSGEEGESVVGGVVGAAVGPSVDQPIEGFLLDFKITAQVCVVAVVVAITGHAKEGLRAFS
mmetsp:Transcript_41299/g.86648  ORF Transcript_41299/g.86648 Transcript_41299/m.86648 type:complete len:168 (+) Transcript_41299:1505-2008(+)